MLKRSDNSHARSAASDQSSRNNHSTRSKETTAQKISRFSVTRLAKSAGQDDVRAKLNQQSVDAKTKFHHAAGSVVSSVSAPNRSEQTKLNANQVQKTGVPADSQPANPSTATDATENPATGQVAATQPPPTTNPVDDFEGMPLEDDITNPQLHFVKYAVQQAESLGIEADAKTLDAIERIDFTDTDFVEQAYDWADDLETSNPEFAKDVKEWLTVNGAFDPDEAPPVAHFEVENVPEQDIYDTPADAVQGNGVPTVGGQPVDEFSVLDLPSGVPLDPNNPGAGELTVQEAAQQEQYFEYKKGVENGTIPPDDPRAQYVDALEAKAALDGGYDLVPAYEDPRIGDNTNQKYPNQGNINANENADGQVTYELSEADAAELINEEAVDAKIEELWNDPTIQADFAENAQEIIDDLPNKEALASELSAAISSPEYLKTLKDMEASGFSTEAMQLTVSNLSNLALLDPELAVETQINLALSTVASELNDLFIDPSEIDIETIELAITDAIELTTGALTEGLGLIRHSASTIDKYIAYANEFVADKEKVTALATTYKQLVIDAKNGMDVDLSNISVQQFESAMERTYIPANMRGGLTEFVVKAQDMGVWGTLSAGASLASFGYQIASGSWDADATAEDRWGAARDVITFASVVSGHSSKTAAAVADSITDLYTGTSGSTTAYQALGLDRTLPELFGVKSLVPSELRWGNFWQSYDADLDKTRRPLLDITGSDADSVGTVPLTDSMRTVDTIDDIFAAKAPLTAVSASTKVAGTVLKVLGTFNDVFGVTDIVMGAIAAKQAVEAGDKPMAAVASLQAVSGALSAAAGGIAVATLVAQVPAVVGVAAAGMLATGAVIGVIALAVVIGVSIHRRNENRQQNVDSQGAFFQRLADQGLTQPDWGDKLEYLRYAWSTYGNDNPDPTQSYFDYQQAEWEHFKNTPPHDGTSLNRLSSDLHVYHSVLTLDSSSNPYTEWDLPSTA